MTAAGESIFSLTPEEAEAERPSLTIEPGERARRWVVRTARTRIELETPLEADEPARVISIDHAPPPGLSGGERPSCEAEAKGGSDAGAPAPSLRERMRAFSRAARSLITEGPAPEEVIAARLVICTGRTPGGEEVAPPCPSLAVTPTGRYCGACGCWRWRLARLDPDDPADLTTSKLAFPALRCPRDRFFEAAGRRASGRR